MQRHYPPLSIYGDELGNNDGADPSRENLGHARTAGGALHFNIGSDDHGLGHNDTIGSSSPPALHARRPPHLSVAPGKHVRAWPWLRVSPTPAAPTPWTLTFII